MSPEQRFRLLWDGEPTGFMRITDAVGFSINNETWANHDEGVCVNGMAIVWNSSELGIKVGNEWWFEGDKFSVVFCEQPREVILKYGNYGWYWELVNVGTRRTIKFGDYLVQNIKRIGNIHEEDVDDG